MPGSPATNYPLRDLEAGIEASRLSTQYKWIKDSVGRPQLLPPSIDLSSVHRVMDIACGTGEWLLDLSESLPLRQPTDASAGFMTHSGAASEAPVTSSPPLELFGCDLNLAVLSGHKNRLDSIGVRIFQQDATTDFPEEMYGTFDLVHASLLALAFTKKQWKLFLENAFKLLRPGGYIYLMDIDGVLTSAELPAPEIGSSYDFRSMMDGHTATHKLNSLWTGTSVSQGFHGGSSYELDGMLSSASFEVDSREIFDLPVGDLCDTVSSAYGGASLAHQRQNTVESFFRIFDSGSKSILERGARLECPKGVRIGSEQERRRLMPELRRSLERGVMLRYSEWVGRKPGVVTSQSCNESAGWDWN